MRKPFIVFLSLLFIIVCCFLSIIIIDNKITKSSALPENKGLYIIIDAGHGGMDGGTSAADGTLEKDINLSIAHKLNLLLKSCGFDTLLLREKDELIGDNSLSTIRERKVSDIKTRLDIIESYPDSILISIHQNYYPVSKYSGTQVFYSSNASQSRFLAQSVQDSVVKNIQPENKRQIKEVGSNIYLLYNCTLPAIMIECGFLSNSEESEKLKNEKYQKQISFSIMTGILNYLE